MWTFWRKNSKNGVSSKIALMFKILSAKIQNSIFLVKNLLTFSFNFRAKIQGKFKIQFFSWKICLPLSFNFRAKIQVLHLLHSRNQMVCFCFGTFCRFPEHWLQDCPSVSPNERFSMGKFSRVSTLSSCQSSYNSTIIFESRL